MARKKPFDFERWLESEMRGRVGAEAGPNPHPAQSRYQAYFLARAASASRRRGVRRFLVTPAFVAAAALTTAGAVGAAAAGTGNTAAWGARVTAAVADCKAALGTGEHGIGDCVSAVASEKGQAERSAHASNGDHGLGAQGDNGNGSANGQGNGAANGKSDSHPTPDANHGNGTTDHGASGKHGAHPTPGPHAGGS